MLTGKGGVAENDKKVLSFLHNLFQYNHIFPYLKVLGVARFQELLQWSLLSQTQRSFFYSLSLSLFFDTFWVLTPIDHTHFSSKFLYSQISNIWDSSPLILVLSILVIIPGWIQYPPPITRVLCSECTRMGMIWWNSRPHGLSAERRDIKHYGNWCWLNKYVWVGIGESKCKSMVIITQYIRYWLRCSASSEFKSRYKGEDQESCKVDRGLSCKRSYSLC